MTLILTPTPAPAAGRAGGSVLLRKLADRVTITAAYAGGLLVIVLLAVMAIILLRGAWPAMQAWGWSFMTGKTWDVGNDDPDHFRPELYGAFPAIFGTLVTAFVALLVAVPVSLGAAVFLVRIAPRAAKWTGGRWASWLVEAVSFLIELLAAIPSITYGLWGIAVLQPFMADTVIKWLHATIGKWHWFVMGKTEFDDPIYFPAALFEGGNNGQGMLTASVVLAIMIIPIITAVTRDVLRAVPKELEQGAYGVGATWWQATKVVLSYAKGGIFGAIVLGLARAIGETMAVAMLLPNSNEFTWSLLGSGSTMTTQLANSYREAKSPLQIQSLTYMALVLLVVTLVINTAARVLVYRSTRRSATK
jgi:phosphate transport system permease protein